MHYLHIHVKHEMHDTPFCLYSSGGRVARMVMKQKPQRARTKHYFKEWRQFLQLTQERALERLDDWSQSKLSRIEANKTPFNSEDLAELAAAYDRSTYELMHVNPLKEGEIVDITHLLQNASPEKQQEVIDFARFVIGRSNQS